MRKSVLRVLAVVVIVLVAAAVVGAVAYHFGVTNANGTAFVRGGMMRGGRMLGWGDGVGFGLFGLLGFVLVGVLVFWLLAALLSPNRGGPISTGPAAGDVERLRELSEMHDRGQLNDEEFAAAKRKLLGLG